jgi:hypothetical protein
MELNQYLFGLVVSIGVIHVATVAGKYIGAFRSRRFLTKKGPQADSRERDDWYVFSLRRPAG